MAKKSLPAKARKAWENVDNCNCGSQQDDNGCHKICYWCNGIIEYGAYEGWQQDNPNCWNVEHLTPKRDGGTSRKYNLKAVHKKCNK